MNQAELVRPMAQSTPIFCTSLMTHLRCGVQPRARSLSPPLLLPSHWLHSWKLLPSRRVTLCSCFILGTRDCRSLLRSHQTPLWASWKPQPVLVRSPLAELNIEPLGCCKRFNKFLLQSLHNAFWFKRPKSSHLLFPSPICWSLFAGI